MTDSLGHLLVMHVDVWLLLAITVRITLCLHTDLYGYVSMCLDAS